MRNRLLDEIDAHGFELRDRIRGSRFAPGLIDVDSHAGTVADSALDGCHVRDIGTDFIAPDFQLEDIVPTARQHFLGFGDVPRGIAAG